MFCVANRRQTSKRMYFLTCRVVNPSKNTVYDALRTYGRRIRLTGCIGKTAYKHLLKYINRNNIIIPLQYGFIRRDSTTDRLHYENTPIQLYMKCHHLKLKICR